jgi:hypothetical protein
MQASQDSHSSEATAVVPYQEVIYLNTAFDAWWFLHTQWLHPTLAADRTAWVPREQYPRHELLGVVPLDSQSPSGTSEAYYAGSSPSDAVRGVVFTHVNVRTSQIVDASYSTGSRGQRPIYSYASYAAAPADPDVWSDVFAFGGRDPQGVVHNDFFVAKHTTTSTGTASYAWERRPSGPSARERASIAVSGHGNHVYLFGGRNGASTLSDFWSFNVSTQTWALISLSAAVPARYDAGITIIDDLVYIGGGVSASATYLGDLIRIDGTSGQVLNYGSVLPSGALPDLVIDDHGDALVLGGGYVGTTWYRDVWRVNMVGTAASSSFVHDFASDGLVASERYAVVPDLQHGFYWGVPGYTAASAKGAYFFDSYGGTTGVGTGPQSALAAGVGLDDGVSFESDSEPTGPMRAPPGTEDSPGEWIPPGSTSVGPQ